MQKITQTITKLNVFPKRTEYSSSDEYALAVEGWLGENRIYSNETIALIPQINGVSTYLTTLQEDIVDKYGQIGIIKSDIDLKHNEVMNRVYPTEVTYTPDEINNKDVAAKQEAFDYADKQVSKSLPLIDLSRVETYVDNGIRKLKNYGVGKDITLSAGQMLEINNTAISLNHYMGNTYTLMFSFKANTDGHIFSGSGHFLIYTNSSGKLTARVSDSGAAKYCASVKEGLNDGNYHKVAIVLTSTSLKLYIDGVLDSTHTLNNLGNDRLISIGTSSSNCLINNLIHISRELTIYDIALDYSLEEIMIDVSCNIIQSPFSFDRDDILFHFPMTEGKRSGGSIFDIRNTKVGQGNIATAPYTLVGVTDNQDGSYDFTGAEQSVRKDDFGLRTNGLYTVRFKVSNYVNGILRYYFATGGTYININANGTYEYTSESYVNADMIHFLTTVNSSFTLSDIEVITENDSYPISNYSDAMWTNAQNLSSGLQKCLLVEDAVNGKPLSSSNNKKTNENDILELASLELSGSIDLDTNWIEKGETRTYCMVLNTPDSNTRTANASILWAYPIRIMAYAHSNTYYVYGGNNTYTVPYTPNVNKTFIIEISRSKNDYLRFKIILDGETKLDKQLHWDSSYTSIIAGAGFEQPSSSIVGFKCFPYKLNKYELNKLKKDLIDNAPLLGLS